MRPDLEALCERTLSLGGERVVGDAGWLEGEFDPIFVVRLLAAGRVFEGFAPGANGQGRIFAGEPIRCHDNAKAYVRLHPTAVWWTGLALSADGAWRSHSWATTGHGALIETTVARLRYFGLPAAFDPSFDDDFLEADRTRLRRRFGLTL